MKKKSPEELEQERKYSLRLKELEKLEPIDFETLEYIVKKWIFIKDEGLLRFHTAVPLIHLRANSPVWVFLVGPSGGGKTQLLDCFSDVPSCHFISSLTPNTFLSGMPGDNDASLLPKLNNKMMVFKDWTSIMSMKFEARNDIMGQLREIYDGKFIKSFGTGKTRIWEGRVSLYAGVTEMIDMQQQSFASLGERFINYRIETADRVETTSRALENNKHKEAMKKELANAFYSFYKSLGAAAFNGYIDLDATTKSEIIEIANFCTLARSSVVRDFGFSKDALFVPSPEMPTRIAEQLESVLQGLSALRGGEGFHASDMKIIIKIALDSIPKLNRACLKIVATTNEVSTEDVATVLGLATTVTKNILENLALIGDKNEKILIRIKGKDSEEDKRSDKWKIRDDFRKILMKYDNVKPIEIIDSPRMAALKNIFGDLKVENQQEEIF